MLIHLNSGRRADIDPASFRPPTSALASAAQHEARSRLSPALLNHSYRTYALGVALGALANIGVDRELLFAAAMLHDTGLARPVDSVDFTFASAHVATHVAETVGLSTAATQTIRTAITLHYSPGSHSPTARSPICWPRAPEWTSPGCGPGNCRRWCRCRRHRVAAAVGFQAGIRRSVSRRSRRRTARSSQPPTPLRRHST